MDWGEAKELKIHEKFYRANDKTVHKRITFEGKDTVAFRCTVNIAALRGHENVVFIPVYEGVVGF